MPLTDPLVDDLRQRNRDRVEHEPCTERDHHEESEDHRGGACGEPDVGRSAAFGGVSLFVRHRPNIDRARDHADQAGDQKSPAPGDSRGQRRGDAGRERNPEIAADPVERQRAAALDGVLQDHRGADRMVDRRKHAEREQSDGKRGERWRRRGAKQRNPAAEVKRDHHVAAAPAIGQPACRQGEQSERNEGGRAEPDKLGIRAPINHHELKDDGRIDQDHKVIDRMRPIEKADGEPASRYIRGVVGGVSALSLKLGQSLAFPGGSVDLYPPR